MRHPTLEALLEPTAESALHLEGCDDCRRMSLLLAAAGSGEATPPALPLEKVPLVERRFYVDWEEMPEAHGGMGRLFRAFDTRLGREVAVKQVRAAQDLKLGAFHRALLHRLEREARLTARLQHPNIVVIYEVGRFEDGEFFYSMPLVRGRPLSREIERRPGLPERIGLLAQVTNVAEAIAYSHSAGVLHRDVKPENVLIGAFGESVLIDWGLAKEIGAPEIDFLRAPLADAGLTQLGIGTPQYMAPEQARGEPPTPAVDIYALGATLYHVLSGAPPYGVGDAREVRRLLLQGPPRPLAELQPATPPELLHICARAMGRTPAQRYSSARELVDELRRFQTGRLLGSRRYSAAELLRHWARKHRALLTLAASALLILLVVTGFGVLQIDRHRRAAEEERARAERSLRSAQGVLASKLAAEPRERLSALELAVRAAAPELLGLVPGAPSPEARQALFDALAAGPAPLALNHSGSVTNFAVSPDGALLAGTGDDRKLFLWSARSGRRLSIFDSLLERPHQVRFSPDGRWLSLCGGQPGAELFEVASGRRVALPTRLPPWCEFSRDGALVAAAEELVLYDPATGKTQRRDLPRPARRLATGKAGTLAVALNDGSLNVIAGGDSRQLLAPGATATSLVFDGSGDSLALIRTGGAGFLWSTEGWSPRQISWTPPGHAIASRARFAPGGALLAVPLWGEEAVRTLVFDAKTGEQTADVAAFAQEWAGPNRFFADARGPLQLVDARDGRVALSLRGHRDEVKAAAWLGDAVASASRDHDEFLWDLSGLFLGHTGEVAILSRAGGRLLSAGLDGTVRLWSISGEELWTLRQGSTVTRASFSPGGDLILAGFLDGEVRAIEAATGTSRVIFRASGPVTVARFAGQRALVAALDGSLAWVDLHSAVKRDLQPHGAVLAADVEGAALVTAHADGSVRLWDLEGTERAVVRDEEPFVSVIMHGERVLLSHPDGRTRIVNARDLSALGELEGRAADSGNAFSRDGFFAAIASDGRVLVHDLATGAKHDAGRGRGIALATAFSADGALLASGGLDGVLRVVDWKSGEVRAQLDAGEGPLTALAFGEDGRTIFAGYASGALRAFPAAAEAALERACAVLRRFEKPAYCDRTAASANQMRDR